jgi:hypothetical protein
VQRRRYGPVGVGWGFIPSASRTKLGHGSVDNLQLVSDGGFIPSASRTKLEHGSVDNLQHGRATPTQAASSDAPAPDLHALQPAPACG